MTPDRLAELLKRADASAGSPPLAPDLERRVRAAAHRDRRGRRLAILGGIAAAAAAVAFAVRFSGAIDGDGTSSGTIPPLHDAQRLTTALAPAEIDRLRSEIARLDAEATSRLYLLARTDALAATLRERDARQRALAAPDVVAEARRQLETAAYLALWQGERLERAAAPAAAAAVYRDAISIFPSTRWAEVARRRLNQIEHQQGDAG